jgi:hypothetical protein
MLPAPVPDKKLKKKALLKYSLIFSICNFSNAPSCFECHTWVQDDTVTVDPPKVP